MCPAVSQMRMRVVEPRHRERSAQIDHLRPRALELCDDPGIVTGRQNLPMRNRHRRHPLRMRALQTSAGQNISVVVDRVGRRSRLRQRGCTSHNQPNQNAESFHPDSLTARHRQQQKKNPPQSQVAPLRVVPLAHGCECRRLRRLRRCSPPVFPSTAEYSRPSKPAASRCESRDGDPPLRAAPSARNPPAAGPPAGRRSSQSQSECCSPPPLPA